MSKNIQLSLLSVALLSQLHATEAYSVTEIKVTASQGSALNKKDVTDNVTIITKESLEESHISTLSDALSTLGNIALTQNGGAGTNTSLYVRGMDSKRTLVLIDGIRYNNPTAIGASAELESLMLFNVDQIEIIKGAQSGVWGSDASGGVVNIITSKPKQGSHFAYNLESGSFDTTKISLNSSYANEKFDISLSALSYTTGGFSAVEPAKSEATYTKRYDELNLERDSYENKSLNLKLGYNLTQNDRIETMVQTIDSNVEFDSGAGSAQDSNLPNTTTANKIYNVKFLHTDSLNKLRLNYNLSLFNRDIELASWSGSGVDNYNYKGSLKEFNIDDTIHYAQEDFIRFGASYQKFEQEEMTPNSNKSYSTKSAFATSYNKFQTLSHLNTIVTLSARYDKYDTIDASTTGKIGIKQFLYKDFYISSNIGTGFNAPTLGQLYGQFGANPNLKPEKSLTADFTFGNNIFWLSGFYNTIEDLIEYDMTTYAYVQTEGKSKFKGIEVGYEDFYFDTLAFKAMYTYLKTQNAQKQELARRPKHQLDTNVLYYINDDFDIALNGQYIGERYDSANKTGAQTGKYALANLTTNYHVDKYINYYAKINNISDKYYQSVDGYATAGRSFYLGFNLKY